MKKLFALVVLLLPMILQAQPMMDLEMFLGFQSVGMTGLRNSEINHWKDLPYNQAEDKDFNFEQVSFIRPTTGAIFNYFPQYDAPLGVLIGLQYTGFGQRYSSRMMQSYRMYNTRKLDYIQLPVGFSIGMGETVRFDMDVFLTPGILISADDNYVYADTVSINTLTRHQAVTFGGGFKLGPTFYIDKQLGIGLYLQGQMDFTDAENKSATFNTSTNPSQRYPVYHAARKTQNNYGLGGRFSIHYKVIKY